MHRSTSPALSENEVDISRSLFQHGTQTDSDSELGFESDADPPQWRAELGNGESDDDDEAFIAATQANANRQNGAKTAKKAGAFQTMGLNAHLLKAITRMGFTVPTPIQRLTMPKILEGQDVVGMARTGSGKTAAFVIPMIEKLKSHSVKVGARAVVLSPTRELAKQTLRVVEDLSKGTDLRAILLVGGDSLEDQFSRMASNPDIIIATPGRFEHLKVEMRLDLSSVRYVVFDEADRLFEMGFATQLNEILHSLPASRQTLLFSATLPKSLEEFARAGLQDPKFERPDDETKIPPSLESAFFTVKRSEKEGALLHILQDIIQIPMGPGTAMRKPKGQSTVGSKKRKRGATGPAVGETPSQQSTIVFVATKYHVEYLVSLLKAFGYAVSYVYGTLDQQARDTQVQDFRKGLTNILVVTDIAARGLDIPVLANVINYDFPSQPKSFVHRVGRTARAGKAGWSYNLVIGQDMPYLLDLQLFLSRQLIHGCVSKDNAMFKDSIVVGSMVRDKLDPCVEEVAKLLDHDEDLTALRDVAGRGEQQYLRGRDFASTKSVKRAKQLARSESFKSLNMLFHVDDDADSEQRRMAMLARVSGFRPQETVFEIGRRGAASEAANVMRKRRGRIQPKHQGNSSDEDRDESKGYGNDRKEHGRHAGSIPQTMDIDSEEELVLTEPGVEMDEASEGELELTLTAPEDSKTKQVRGSGWQDSEHFMAYTPTDINLSEDRGLGVHSGSNSNFVEAAKGATMDLANDETKAFGEPSRPRGLRWDKKSKKYVSRANDEDGSKGKKMMRSESGQKIAASFRSGRFDTWRKANKVDRLPGVGEMERKGNHFASTGSQRYRHNMEKAPKEADKYRDDYHKRKKRVSEAKEKRIGRFAEGKGRNELKGVEDVRKARKLKSKRREKNARPSRKT